MILKTLDSVYLFGEVIRDYEVCEQCPTTAKYFGPCRRCRWEGWWLCV